ncbi:MAG: hypothetical protein MI924_18850 [Chloroflexales bacterium]|nr:hypothetical protein [Chloroflexales bacterium]
MQVVWIVQPVNNDGSSAVAADGAQVTPKPKSLRRVIGAFKTMTTKQINREQETPGAIFWQRDFYDRIIRREDELNHIRDYITNNPSRWNNNP